MKLLIITEHAMNISFFIFAVIFILGFSSAAIPFIPKAAKRAGVGLLDPSRWDYKIMFVLFVVTMLGLLFTGVDSVQYDPNAKILAERWSMHPRSGIVYLTLDEAVRQMWRNLRFAAEFDIIPAGIVALFAMSIIHPPTPTRKS